MKYLIVLLLAASPSFALTTVTGTLHKADGTNFTGAIYLSWPSFTNGSGQFIYAGQRIPVLVTAGAISVALEPSVGRDFVYTVQYNLSYGKVTTEFWVVPSTGPVDVSAVRTTTYTYPASTVALSQLGAGGAVQGEYLLFDGVKWTHLPPQSVTFSSVTTATLNHLLNTTSPVWACTLTGSNKSFEPKDVTIVSAATIIFTFDSPTSGQCAAQ